MSIFAPSRGYSSFSHFEFKAKSVHLFLFSQHTDKVKHKVRIQKKNGRYYFQHPYARLFVAYFVIFCNFFIYAEDPVSHSRANCTIPLIGNDFAFVTYRYTMNFCSLRAAGLCFVIRTFTCNSLHQSERKFMCGNEWCDYRERHKVAIGTRASYLLGVKTGCLIGTCMAFAIIWTWHFWVHFWSVI